MKQLFSLTLSVAFAAALLIGCSDGSSLVETDQGSASDNTELAALGKGAPAHFVSVGGHDKEGLDDANYSLTAREDAEGNVTGQFSDIFKVDGSAVGAVHGSVDCLTVVDNKALVGGVITKEYDFYPEGSRFVVLVVDNGTSKNDDPDLITSTFRAGDLTCDDLTTENSTLNGDLEPVIGQVIVR